MINCRTHKFSGGGCTAHFSQFYLGDPCKALSIVMVFTPRRLWESHRGPLLSTLGLIKHTKRVFLRQNQMSSGRWLVHWIIVKFIFSHCFLRKDKLWTKHTGMTIIIKKKCSEPSSLGQLSYKQSNKQLNRLKMYFRLGLPPKNHGILAELAKCTLAGQSSQKFEGEKSLGIAKTFFLRGWVNYQSYRNGESQTPVRGRTPQTGSSSK